MIKRQTKQTLSTMILNFKTTYPWDKTVFTNFQNKILLSDMRPGFIRKIHTIRIDATNRWKPGMKIHFSTGARTKKYKCFTVGKCISTQTIEIEEMIMTDAGHMYIYTEEKRNGIQKVFVDRIFKVTIDGRVLTSAEIDTLARNDGFNSTHDFFRWFNGNFTGKIIHWTDFKY